MTIVEATIATGIMGIVVAGAVKMSESGGSAYQTGVSVTDLEIRGSRALERIVREMSVAQAGSLVPANPNGASSIDFVKPESVALGVVTWGPTVRLVREYDALELDNGIDDDGDGLIDEGVLIRIEDPGGANEQRRVLVRGVAELLERETSNGADDNGNGLIDEEGFSISVQNGTSVTAVTFQLTLEDMGPAGLYQRSMQTTIALKN